jgi:hypothetical protein
MGKDYIPGPDAEFDKFLGIFVAAIVANKDAFGLTDADVKPLVDGKNNWDTDLQADTDAEAAADKAKTQKNKTRADIEGIVRSVTKKLNGHPQADNALRAKAGLPAHDETRSPRGVPTTRPLVRLESSGRWMITVHFVDELTPTKLAKPEGVQGAQIWVFVGDTPPADPEAFRFLYLDTRTPYVHTHAAADAGKTVFYAARWANAKGEVGPWSDVISAKIPL